MVGSETESGCKAGNARKSAKRCGRASCTPWPPNFGLSMQLMQRPVPDERKGQGGARQSDSIRQPVTYAPHGQAASENEEGEA